VKPIAVAKPASIPFVDLGAQRRRLGQKLDAAIARVLAHGAFILGPEVAELEQKLAHYAGVRHCVSCSSGTDALALVLMAKGIGRNDAVFVPAFTFVAPAEVVAWLGATPVFVDVSAATCTMNGASLEAAIEGAKAKGLRPAAVIPVDLFGQPADYRAIAPVAERHGLFVLADAAQSFGASLDGRPVGQWAHATATSFYPSKPLGCYGDGGAVLTDDRALAEALLSLRMHGQRIDKLGAHQYDNVRVGMNGRFDTLQAAILIEKLAIFPDEIAARQRIAERYSRLLSDRVETPALLKGATSVWAQYTIKSEHRDAIKAACAEQSVPTAVHYPLPLSGQAAYRHYPTAPGGVPAAERLASNVLSLPIHPYLDEATQDRIVAAVRGALG
jgi:dTDP-4-amino-4,6-dideoxygalactose transaminase